ncbi:MAG: glycosyltransferase family 4 protein [Polaribacter sp.]|nr:glycosyltransferase family 4 protein [Polaribacter sp.]
MIKSKMLVISNMYPSGKDDYFGVFVKRINENLKQDFRVHEILIKGRTSIFFNKILKYFCFYYKILFNLCFVKFDAIYIHYPPFSLPPYIFSFFLKNKNLILNFHGSDIILKNKPSSFFIKYFYLIKPYVKLIVVPSSYLQKELEKKIYFKNIFISPSGGIPDFFYNNTILKNKVKNKNTRFLYVSTISEEKGIFSLIKSIKQLSLNKNLEVDLTIFGAGEVEILEKKIIGLKNTKFMGLADNNLLPNIFINFDVLIFPTKKESLGLIGVESLACGLPVIASDIPPIKSYIKDSYNGLLFESENTFELMNKIEYLINNPVILNILKLNSRKSVLKFKQSTVKLSLNKKINEFISY